MILVIFNGDFSTYLHAQINLEIKKVNPMQ